MSHTISIFGSEAPANIWGLVFEKDERARALICRPQIAQHGCRYGMTLSSPPHLTQKAIFRSYSVVLKVWFLDQQQQPLRTC